MATINISDLCPTGSDLFSDSESYMNELGDSEVHTIHGGSTPACFFIGVLLVPYVYPVVDAFWPK
jgi:hypothetical protein